MSRTEIPPQDRRLDSKAGFHRWLLLLVGVGLQVPGVWLLGAEVQDGWARWFSLLFFLPGLLLIWLGVRYRRSTFTPEGLLRVGWTGREVVPWSRVESIELDEVAGQDERVGWVRLRLEGGRRVSIRMAPGRVDSRGRMIAEVCPRAFVDDRRSGVVVPPREGDPDEIDFRETALRSRAGSSHLGVAIGWFAGGAMSLLVIVTIAVLELSDHPLESLLGIAVMALAAFAAFAAAVNRLRLRRRAHR